MIDTASDRPRGGISSMGAILADTQIPRSSGSDGEDDRDRTADGQPWCAACRGARWLKRDGFDARRDSASGLVRCPHCRDSQLVMRVNRLARLAGLTEEQRGKAFSSLDTGVRGFAATASVAAEFARRPAGWLVIHGAPGSGKTHLTLAIANVLVSREQAISWWYVPALARALREQVASGVPDAITPVLLDVPVLFLDDLGAARWSDYLTEVLELAFNHRYERRLATVVTLIGDTQAARDPGYDVAGDVRRSLSDSIGRRMQDPAVCKIVRNAAGQYGRAAQGEGRG